MAFSKASVDVYANDHKKDFEQNSDGYREENFVEDYFSTTPAFNYFENNALNPNQSLFLNGIDQRFLDLDYNGFSLRDPSHPTGVFNVNAVLSVVADKSLSFKPSKIKITKSYKEDDFLLLSLSHLGEAQAAFKKSDCSDVFCFNSGFSAKRGGGFSQKSGGVEDDYFNRFDVNFESSSFKEKYEDQTYLMYSYQDYDEDSVGIFSQLEPESLNAFSTSSTLFLGKKYLFKNFKFQTSYLKSDRMQKNRDLNLEFSQQGEVFELQVDYKSFYSKLFNERFDLLTSKDIDSGGVVGFVQKAGVLSAELELGYTDLRKFFGAFDFTYKSLSFFFKALPPSLFQSSFNKKSNNEGLESQNMVGLKYFWSLLKLQNLELNFETVYSRTFDFINYDFSINSYKNLSEVENVSMNLDFNVYFLNAYLQFQKARNLTDDLDLPQRPHWTIGLNSKNRIYKKIELLTSLKRVGQRKAFDNTNLEAFWDTSVALKRGGLSIGLTNIFNEDDEVYKGLERRPLTLEVKYQKFF